MVSKEPGEELGLGWYTGLGLSLLLVLGSQVLLLDGFDEGLYEVEEDCEVTE